MMAEVKIKKFKFFFLILCIIQLFYIFHFRSGFKYEIIKNPFNESSGISYALHPSVVESNDFLKKHKAIDFNLSEFLKKDTYLYQRSEEFIYQIRFNETYRLIFFLKDKAIPIPFKLLEIANYLKLPKC